MIKQQFSFQFEVYESSESLREIDRKLFGEALQATTRSYAPYSNFRVGAAATLANGEIVTGSNHENASFPAGLCAEGTTLAVASALFPGVAITDLAITYQSDSFTNDHPIAPCGICRQQLQEFRDRSGRPIRLIMGGKKGQVIVVEDASMLLPFSFKF